MRKKTFFVTLLCICILAFGIFGVNAFADIIKLHLIENELEDLSKGFVEREFLTEDIFISRIEQDRDSIKNKLLDSGYYLDDINASMNKYIETSIMNDMSNIENKYIMSLVDNGYDFEKLVHIYDFVKNTNENMIVIKTIYDIASPNFEGETWIENAYDIYLGEEKCALSVDDIIAYVNEGISIEEIVLCYELSLNNNKNIRQILDEKVAGADWQNIIVPEIAVSRTVEKMDLKTITTLVSATRKTGTDLVSAIDTDDNGKMFIKNEILDKISDKRQKINNLKNKYKIVNPDDGSIIVEAKKQLKGIDEDKIETLISEGYRIREIKDAINGKNKKTHSSQIMAIINDTEE